MARGRQRAVLPFLGRQNDGRAGDNGRQVRSGTPVALFPATPRQRPARTELFVYDVSRDGQRFLINTQVKQAEIKPMSVVLNWPAKLNK